MSCYKKLSKYNNNSAFLPLQPKMCKGGPYTWNGNSERATYCKTLASTSQGLEEINNSKCCPGLIGGKGDYKVTYTNPANIIRSNRCKYI